MRAWSCTQRIPLHKRLLNGPCGCRMTCCPSLYFPPLYQQVEYKWTLQVSLQCIRQPPPSYDCFVLFLTGEICAFKIHGQEMPFEAVVLNKTSGEGRLRAKSPIDCELQKEYTFIIQAYDCGSGPGGTNWKKSHKWVKMRRNIFSLWHTFTLQSILLSGRKQIKQR